MIFASGAYLLFLPIVLGLYWSLRDHQHRKLLLIAASLFFYGWWDYRFLILLVGTCLVNAGLGIRLLVNKAGQRSRTVLAIGIGFNLAVLFLFKYESFFIDSLATLLQSVGVHPRMEALRVVLPLGISFFTFQGISYLVDIYRNKISTAPPVADFFLYKVFFPQLIAGPIVRAVDFLPQLKQKKIWGQIDLRYALVLLLLGYLKKSVLADSLGSCIDPYFYPHSPWSGAARAVALVGYTWQIYFDFSGYTDMALGSAALFGFRLVKNFEAPYTSQSLTEFWTRWHISLSTWLRDYVYIPLGGNRAGAGRRDMNVFTTMLLGGLWHGASWNFVGWGALHGIGLIWEKHFPLRLPAFFRWLGTFAFVCLSFAFFRIQSFGTTLEYLRQVLTLAPGQPMFHAEFYIPFFLVLTVVHWAERWRREELAAFAEQLSARAFSTGYGLAVSLVLAFSNCGLRPFVYFQF